MTGPGAAAEKRRGYVVFRQVEPGVWYLVGDVDYQPGLSARAERAHAVHDATGGAARASCTPRCRAISGTWCTVPERAAGPGFVILRGVGNGRWRVVGEADRRPGLSAEAARAQAVRDATGSPAGAGETYAVVLRSEWRVAQRL